MCGFPGSWEVKDACSDLKATLKGGAKRTEEGLVLDGKKGYAKIDNWEWGGTTSVEVLVKYDSFDTQYGKVFYFGANSGSDDAISICNNNSRGKARIYWEVRQGGSHKSICKDSTCWDLAWTHVVVTVCGDTMKIYQNGQLAETKTDGHEPRTVTRESHCIGSFIRSQHFVHGKVAYLRMWQGHEITDSEASALFDLAEPPS